MRTLHDTTLLYRIGQKFLDQAASPKLFDAL
jgi:hypothetical protein